MPAPIIEQDASLESVLEQNTHTLTWLLAYPFTQGLAAPFQAQQERWMAVDRQEILLWMDILKATTQVSVADEALDALVDAIANTILAEAGNDRSAPLYTLYFGNQRPSDLKRPVLGGQLETMRAWLPSLTGGSQALRALGEQLAAAIQKADAATAALAAAKQKNREFRTVGERKAFIDAQNALRKSTYGALSEMPHKHPDKRLPNTFADLFFKRLPRRKTAAEEPEPATAAELTAKIAEVEQQLAALKTRYTEVLAAEEVSAREKAQREADAAALAEAEKAAEALAARVTALRAKLGR
ncbi:MULTISPECIES: hypothetical protein [Sorangium]|uniref:Uncharacterized protein n=1 Tax=Sorangium cellulosum TaxID=56 RepID=A0A4P2R3W2_SORCE|nr:MULTISPECIES: hypothetical protein [Sorangium]AUX37291.1 uncharacterized protein SOCE836_095130 [Sorangium cellulosum]WCQ96580.1 hypothetical protein NQZ70_09367 [Sorangium sp. Soce836]